METKHMEQTCKRTVVIRNRQVLVEENDLKRAFQREPDDIRDKNW